MERTQLTSDYTTKEYIRMHTRTLLYSYVYRTDVHHVDYIVSLQYARAVDVVYTYSTVTIQLMCKI